MRKANEKVFDSDVYARIQAMRLSETDRREALAAMQRAEQISEAILWVGNKFSDIGHWFLKPSLRH